MKHILLLLLIVFCTRMLFSQDLKINSGMVASGGINALVNGVTLSKWRLGEVHQVVLEQKEKSPLVEINTWEVSSYPNPFDRFLYLRFKSAQILPLTIQVSSLLGQQQLLKVEKTVLPNQIIQLDLDFLVPEVYLLTIVSADRHYSKALKIQKQ